MGARHSDSERATLMGNCGCWHLPGHDQTKEWKIMKEREAEKASDRRRGGYIDTKKKRERERERGRERERERERKKEKERERGRERDTERKRE